MSQPKSHPSASLYVGDLLPIVTEGMLFELFNHIGPLASIRVCRDNLTRRSLGYAYVNFSNVTDAERALDTLNNSLIKNKPCRIMWCQRDPSVRKSGVGNIFIKNLDPSIGHKELYDTFSAFGNILSCKVVLDENGHSKGYGFVHFGTMESADDAIKTVNQKMLKTKKVFVGKFVTKKDRMKQLESSWTNVYVKDLDPLVTSEELTNVFGAYGNITSAIIMRNENGTSKGFGYVNFASHFDAVKAVEKLDKQIINEKTISCCRHQKKVERQAELRKRFMKMKREQFSKYQGTNLYIKNLEDDVKEDTLRKEFSVFGSIRSVKIMTDSNGNSKGFGFVCFQTPDEASMAVNEMNGRTLQGINKPLYVAIHEPKDIRRQKLTQRYAHRSKSMRPMSVPMPPGSVYHPSSMYYNHGGSAPYVYPQPQPPMVRGPPASRGQWAQPQQYPMQAPPNYPPSGRGRGARGVSSSATGGRASNNRNENAGQNVRGLGQLENITLSQLTGYLPEQQKLVLGERLYHQIYASEPVLAGKITGMLLDSGWNSDELFSLLENGDKLKLKIEEAREVLNRSSSDNYRKDPVGEEN